MTNIKKETGHKIFNFWKGNRTDGHFQLTDVELAEKFKEYLSTKTFGWVEYYNISDCVADFVSRYLDSPENSDNDYAEHDTMTHLLQPIRKNYLKSL